MEQRKKILSDSVWSVSGLVLMNVMLQFAVYPFWERQAGEAALGNILYLISLMNVFSVSLGVSVNYARMKRSAVMQTYNTPYILILAVASLVAFAVAFLISTLGGVDMSFAEILLFGTLMCVTMWRYYADVEYKLYLNYKSFFLYYLFISFGYAVGVGVYYLTELWTLTLIIGELFGLFYVLARGRVLRYERGAERAELGDVTLLVLTLFGAEAISTLIFNADRIMLKAILGEVAVTEYYLASLLGKTIALLTVPLSGVVIGYLSKYKGELTKKGMSIITLASLGAVVLGTLACTAGSYIIIPILYPNQFENIKSYFILTNLSQVLYFIANVMTVILLRFARSRYQLYVNIGYAISFVAICVPMTLWRGFASFCGGLVITCGVRYLISIGLGYYSILVKKKRNLSDGA